jgi:hypothetical protein
LKTPGSTGSFLSPPSLPPSRLPDDFYISFYHKTRKKGSPVLGDYGTLLLLLMYIILLEYHELPTSDNFEREVPNAKI